MCAHGGGGPGVLAQLCEAQPAWAPRVCTGGGSRAQASAFWQTCAREDTCAHVCTYTWVCLCACVWARPVRTPLCMSMFVRMCSWICMSAERMGVSVCVCMRVLPGQVVAVQILPVAAASSRSHRSSFGN